MEIAAVDVTICIIIAISGIISLIRGFIKEAMSLVIWLAAFFVAMSFKEVFAELLVGLIELASMRQLAAWGILFVATLLLGAMVNFNKLFFSRCRTIYVAKPRSYVGKVGGSVGIWRRLPRNRLHQIMKTASHSHKLPQTYDSTREHLIPSHSTLSHRFFWDVATWEVAPSILKIAHPHVGVC